MSNRIENTYSSWKDSSLLERITNPKIKDSLDRIWKKASVAYPRATWKGWVDHSETHILTVLRNLDRLIPDYVFNDISEQEAFVLIAATLLHDIGMIPQENASADLQYLANLRLRHGEKGAEIIKNDFSDFLTPVESVLHPVCEIVKNHHGEFNPHPLINLPYNIRADALWVRLADELDFGPNHAPSWLLDYIKPDETELEHWRRHNEIYEPLIDLEFFRIQVWGIVENESFILKLRKEFETRSIQDLQTIFLNRNRPIPSPNRTFLIWDSTEKKTLPGEDSKGIDSRPAIFYSDQFLSGARYLYNWGRYKVARECFEEGANRLGGRWSDSPLVNYFYHYLKTLISIGEYKKALEIAEQYSDTDFYPEIRAAVATSNGIAHWKLGHFDHAINHFIVARDIYKALSKDDSKHKVNEADAWILYAIALLEKIRSSNNISNNTLIKNVERGLNNADKLYLEYEGKSNKRSEPHYRGRYWGLNAFFCLLKIDIKSTKEPEEYTEALDSAERAYGGKEMAHRNPFGAMCGKYCASAVNYHKYENCENDTDKLQALLDAARLIKEVRQNYDNLFGHTTRIYQLWPKIHRLFVLIRQELPGTSKKLLSDFCGGDEPVEEIEIYTPLN